MVQPARRRARGGLPNLTEASPNATAASATARWVHRPDRLASAPGGGPAPDAPDGPDGPGTRSLRQAGPTGHTSPTGPGSGRPQAERAAAAGQGAASSGGRAGRRAGRISGRR
ncbi:hypothetical protein GCM10010273_65330 [Streptomyces lavendulocolor]